MLTPASYRHSSGAVGYSTISITLDLCSHAMPSMQREAAAALDEVLAAGR